MLCFCLKGPIAVGQYGNFKFKHLGVEQGLSHVTINEMIQDRHGALWVGTTDGLNRYNGYDFKVFKSDTKVPNSLFDNNINALYEDATGLIWIGTFDGLHYYDQNLETFTRLPDAIHEATGIRIYEITSKSESELWIGSEKGLFILDTPSLSAQKVKTTEGLGSVHRLFHRNDQQLWVGTLEQGVFLYNPEQESLKSFELFEETYPVWDFHEDHSGILWVGINGGGLWYAGANEEELSPFKGTNISNDKVLSIYEDNAHNLWVGTDQGGVNKISPNRKRVYQYKHKPGTEGSLSSSDIRTIFEDRKGTLWFGTWGGGLSLVILAQERFARFTASGGAIHSLSSNFTQAIL